MNLTAVEISDVVLSGRPGPSEYGAFFAGYIRLVQTDDIVQALSRHLGETSALLRRIPEASAALPHVPGKWTFKEVLGHVIDAERIFACRALRIARNDKTPLPGFEQDEYMAAAAFNRRPWLDLIEEFEAVRHSNLLLLSWFDREAWDRRGTVSGYETSARALAFCIAGHELHHMLKLRAAVGEGSQ